MSFYTINTENLNQKIESELLHMSGQNVNQNTQNDVQKQASNNQNIDTKTENETSKKAVQKKTVKKTKSNQEKLDEIDKQMKKLKAKKRKLRAQERERNLKIMTNILNSEFDAKTPEELQQEIEKLKSNNDNQEQLNDDQVSKEGLNKKQQEIEELNKQIKTLKQYKQFAYNLLNKGHYNSDINLNELESKIMEIITAYRTTSSDIGKTGFTVVNPGTYSYAVNQLIDNYITQKHIDK